MLYLYSTLCRFRPVRPLGRYTLLLSPRSSPYVLLVTDIRTYIQMLAHIFTPRCTMYLASLPLSDYCIIPSKRSSLCKCPLPIFRFGYRVPYAYMYVRSDM